MEWNGLNGIILKWNIFEKFSRFSYEKLSPFFVWKSLAVFQAKMILIQQSLKTKLKWNETYFIGKSWKLLLSNDSSNNGMEWNEWNHLKVKYFKSFHMKNSRCFSYENRSFSGKNNQRFKYKWQNKVKI